MQHTANRLILLPVLDSSLVRVRSVVHQITTSTDTWRRESFQKDHLVGPVRMSRISTSPVCSINQDRPYSWVGHQQSRSGTLASLLLDSLV
jgi:hypothetical protein